MCAAPNGNQFWKARSRHGRDRLFADAELLKEAAEEYFNWCEEHPIIEHDFRGKDATPVEIKKMRAYTYEGLTNYFGASVQYLNDMERAIKARIENGTEKPDDHDFSAVIAYIRQCVRQQKFQGAAAGQLNATIIARDLGLADKTQIGGDPDNPLTPIQQIVVFQLPENTRNNGLLDQKVDRVIEIKEDPLGGLG